MSAFPRIALMLIAALAIGGCASNMYELPAPPEEGERADAELASRAEEEQKQKEYAAARAALLKAYNLLSTQRYDEAVALMSQETRALLTYNTDDSAADVLADGALTLPSGERIEFEPSTFFIAADVQKVEDDLDGVEQNETDRRREFFVVSEDGSARRVVMIKQGDEWVLHKTRVGGETVRP